MLHLVNLYHPLMIKNQLILLQVLKVTNTHLPLRIKHLLTLLQTNCSTYNNEGQLNYANRYSIREWDHNALDRELLHNDQMIFQKLFRK